MNVLHLSLLKSFDLNICSKDPMKNSTLGYFCKIIYSQMHCKFQPWCLFVRWLLHVPFFDLKFFCPHIMSHGLFAKCFKHLWRKGCRKLKTYTFLWFKKRDLFLMGGNYKWILPKNMLSSSLVDIIFLHTFLL